MNHQFKSKDAVVFECKMCKLTTIMPERFIKEVCPEKKVKRFDFQSRRKYSKFKKFIY